VARLFDSVRPDKIALRSQLSISGQFTHRDEIEPFSAEKSSEAAADYAECGQPIAAELIARLVSGLFETWRFALRVNPHRSKRCSRSAQRAVCRCYRRRPVR
jgi:hypothetical protein